jgi:starch-binding outer membrane protein, SusD/RagB family
MKKILFILLGVLPFMSCSDWLSLEPVDKLNDVSYYKTPEQIKEALTATYNVLCWDGATNILYFSELASDNCFHGGGNGDATPDIDIFRKNVDLCKDQWTKCYTGIFRANSIIDKLDGVEWKNTNLRPQYESEARFLRAYYYFDLVRMFGNVPLLKQALKGSDSYKIPQANPDDVYKLIAQDLKFAAANLPDKSYSSISDADRGHATKWAAESLLARVFLYYTGYYKKSDLVGEVSKQDALNGLEDVIQHSGHDLLTNFASLWQADDKNYNENNKEYVFAIKYTSAGKGDWNLRNGNRMQVLISIRGQSIANYLNGWGAGTVNSKLWNTYDATDTRRSASIISIEDEGLKNVYKLDDQREYTGYFWKKFTRVKAFNCVDVGGDFQIDNDADVPVIRYSDVLLMAAELGSTSAQNYYDKVRDRAYGDDKHHLTVSTENIMKERYLEFALEGQRYWDLLRQGMNVTKAAIDNVSSDPLMNITFRTETLGLWPIPESQISLSGGTLKQNPGW